MSRSRVSCLSLTLLATTSVVLSGCGTSGGTGSSGQQAISLGATNVLTGAIASVCKPITDGADAWFKQVNAQGGINGHKIDYTVLDDAYDAARATANARKLVNQKVAALVAGCGTANEQAAYATSSRSGVPLIGPYANLPKLLSPTTDNYFGLFPIYGEQDAAAISAGLKKLGTGTVLHIAQNSAGVDGENALAEAGAQKAGARWLGTELVDPKTADYTPLALKVKAQRPDYILISTGDAQAAQIILALQAQKATPAKAFLITFASTDALLSTAGDALGGHAVSVTSPKVAGSSLQGCLDVIKKYESASDANVHGVYGCSVAQVVTAALKKVKGTVTSKSLETALNTLSDDNSAAAFGPVTFSQSHHAGVTTGTVYAVETGKFVEQGAVAYGAP